MNGQTHPRRTLRLSGDPFWDLVATAKRLQAPGGCAWDRAQTLQSLVPHLIEETWEVFEAVRSRQRQHLQEELGDVLYTVLFLALIAERRGFIDLRTLLNATRRKMVRRHPHVFGTRYAATPRDAYNAWQATKRREPGRLATSRSKALRPLLVDWWDALRREPKAASVMRRTLARLWKVTGRPKRPSARQARATARS